MSEKKEKKHTDYLAFLQDEGIDLIKSLCEKYKEVPKLEEDDSFYTDFGAKNRLSLDEIGTAECSAGLFDMLDLDKKMITDTMLQQLKSYQLKGQYKYLN